MRISLNPSPSEAALLKAMLEVQSAFGLEGLLDRLSAAHMAFTELAPADSPARLAYESLGIDIMDPPSSTTAEDDLCH